MTVRPHLYRPHERAIAGEFTSRSDADYDCFIIDKVCDRPGHFSTVQIRWSLVIRV